MNTQTLIIAVRQGNGTYTATARGKTASRSAGEHQTAAALGRKIFGADFLSAEQLPINFEKYGRTQWRLEARKP
jgi:hypothetical protein